LTEAEFEKLVRNHDIICLVESKTDDRDELKLPGYIFKLKNRKKIAKVKSGGILLGFKDKRLSVRLEYDVSIVSFKSLTLTVFTTLSLCTEIFSFISCDTVTSAALHVSITKLLIISTF
jgi:hypothetical protein